MKIHNIFANLTRALEVASVGNLSLQLVYDKNYPQFENDHLLIKSYYEETMGLCHIFAQNGHIIIEMYRPEYNDLNITRGEDKEEVVKRIKEAKARKTNNPLEFGSSACDLLLKSAYDKLNFSLYNVQVIKKVAEAIALLDNSSKIQAEHIAEAIQYRT